MPALDDILHDDTGVFFMFIQFEEMQETNFLVRGWKGRTCYLRSMVPLVTTWHSLSVSHPGFSILYPEPSTYLIISFSYISMLSYGHLHSMSLLNASFLCPCQGFHLVLELTSREPVHHGSGGGARERTRQKESWAQFSISLLTSSVRPNKIPKLSESQFPHL